MALYQLGVTENSILQCFFILNKETTPIETQSTSIHLVLLCLIIHSFWLTCHIFRQ
jgi:hypothetical protein